MVFYPNLFRGFPRKIFVSILFQFSHFNFDCQSALTQLFPNSGIRAFRLRVLFTGTIHVYGTVHIYGEIVQSGLSEKQIVINNDNKV